MKTREQQWRTARKLQRMTGRNMKAAVKMVTRGSTKADGSVLFEEAHTKEGIERFTLEEYEARLHCAYGSPPMQSPLVDDLGYLGIGKSAKQILDGKYRLPTAIDPSCTTALLQQMSWACPTINTADHISGCKRSRENTAPGHSGLTCAHWKASCESPLLASLDASWANYPWITCCSPSRWENAIDILIPKKVESTRVEESRHVCLFEVDCNMNHKRLGRMFMDMAKTNGGLAWEQYGSHKGKAAAEQALNKRLVFDILRQDRGHRRGP
eukprot:scaffold18161_cov56-Attheya_sp.AAC.5